MTHSGGERRTVCYFGTVQGVGFRFTTLRIARGHDVSGYVRNLLNGEVEVVVEGTSDAIEKFLKAVELAMTDCIAGRRIAIEPSRGAFDSFDIRH